MIPHVRAQLAILIPVFNDIAGLRVALASVRNADKVDGLITLVVDDGSQPILELNTADFTDIGLDVLRLPDNQGIEHALNAGLDKLLAEDVAYVARLDAGDTMRRDRLTRQLAYLEQHSDTTIIGSDVEFCDAAGQLLFRQRPPTDDTSIRRRMHFSTALMHPSVMMRATALKKIGGRYSTRFPAAEDYDLFFRLINAGKAASIAESLTRCHWAPNGITARRRRRQLISRLRIQIRYFVPACLESYLGISMTLVLLIIPASVVMGLKRRLSSVPL